MEEGGRVSGEGDKGVVSGGGDKGVVSGEMCTGI